MIFCGIKIMFRKEREWILKYWIGGTFTNYYPKTVPLVFI